MSTLIILESPNKIGLVATYAREVLKGPVNVQACLGHLRDLPEGELHVDINQGFQPAYAVKSERSKVVATLRAAISPAKRVLLATDPDREGEAVAWHICQVFQTELRGKEIARVVFHALTKAAVQQALLHPRPLDIPRIQAAIARRVMDRLFGYTVSPVLWQAVQGRYLSAGRVQTAALRLLVEFEQTQAQQPTQETWTVEVEI